MLASLDINSCCSIKSWWYKYKCKNIYTIKSLYLKLTWSFRCIKILLLFFSKAYFLLKFCTWNFWVYAVNILSSALSALFAVILQVFCKSVPYLQLVNEFFPRNRRVCIHCIHPWCLWVLAITSLLIQKRTLSCLRRTVHIIHVRILSQKSPSPFVCISCLYV